MQSTTKISTQQASRIAKRLLNHWKHKFEVSENDQAMQIFFPNALIRLIPTSEFLQVNITSQSEDLDIEHIQQVVLDHLIRMGQEELSATWEIL